jgi:hypothetical protein
VSTLQGIYHLIYFSVDTAGVWSVNRWHHVNLIALWTEKRAHCFPCRHKPRLKQSVNMTWIGWRLCNAK